MQVKLLHNLVEELAGEETGRIVEILFNKKDVNEFGIAKKMELTINQVRNILYKLSNHGLVSFIRKKDKRKGWYIYYWTLNVEKSLVMLQISLSDKISKLEGKLGERESDRFYVCAPCGIEVSEEKALEHGFSCEECAEVYELSDNSPYIRDIKAKITRTKKELELIETELAAVRERENRRRKRAATIAQKEIDARKELMKKARAAARAKIAAANPKKVVKKTVKKVAKKAVKKTAKKTTKKTTKKTLKKMVKKVAKKVAKKASKKKKKK